jgi:hypothetical protein
VGGTSRKGVRGKEWAMGDEYDESYIIGMYEDSIIELTEN